jgi:hypothetical protein
MGGPSKMIREGEKLRNGFNGRVYRVKAIRNKLVVLDAEEDMSWIITEKDVLGIFYEKVQMKDQGNGSVPPLTPSSTIPEGA